MDPPIQLGLVTLSFITNVPMNLLSSYVRKKCGVAGHYVVFGALTIVVGGFILITLPGRDRIPIIN